MKYFVSKGDDEFEVDIDDAEGGFDVTIAGVTSKADLVKITGEDLWSLLLDGRSFDLLVNEQKDLTTVIHHGLSVEVLVESERERNARLIAAELPSPGGGALVAVMPGIVIAVNVVVGDTVKKGDAIVVLEAMKMENEIRAAVSGVISAVMVTKGTTVNAGDALVEISPA